MRRLNPKLGGSLPHVAIKAQDFEVSLRFYIEGLEFVEHLRFPELGRTVALLDTGDGAYGVLFSPSKTFRRGARHGGALPVTDYEQL